MSLKSLEKVSVSSGAFGTPAIFCMRSSAFSPVGHAFILKDPEVVTLTEGELLEIESAN